MNSVYGSNWLHFCFKEAHMKWFFGGLICLAFVVVSTGSVVAQGGGNPFGRPDPNRPVGLTITSDQVSPGYILLSIIQSRDVMLLSNDGRVVNIWEGQHYLGQAVYLLDNGHLLRTVSLDNNAYGPGGQWGFVNGRVEEVTWDGRLVWGFNYGDRRIVGHHDIEPMPNGHVLMVAFEMFSGDEVLAAGRSPELMPQENALWSEKVIEFDPMTGRVVWEWRVWDHLVQDYDPNLSNYGAVAEHPERIDINYTIDRSIDWLHINAIDYNADLDQIVLSPRTFSEIWIIDHGTTTEEARGPAGDLLYRWGNPAAYRAGSEANRHLYYQHNPQWIPQGYPGAGNLLIFNNGGPERPYSSVIEIVPPIDESGAYIMLPGVPTGPDGYAWQYIGNPPESFYSALISGAQRQPNGNTLITEGIKGRIFEVNPAGEIVWEYYLPPATGVFRAERYNNLPPDLDLSGNLPLVTGAIWGVDCTDGEQPRLYAYLQPDSQTMALFTATYGDQAQAAWENEACAEHGGRVDRPTP
jgi:hypothetical protein